MAERWFIKLLTETYGVTEINKAVAQLRRRLITIQPILEDIGQIYVDEAKYRIEAQSSPKGQIWKHNTKLTQKFKTTGIKKATGFRKPAIEGPNKRLVWTGDLREKLKYRVSGNTVIVLSDVPYATTMQYGANKGQFVNGRVPWGDIPPRPFLGTNKKTNEKVMSILGEYMLGHQVAKQIGFKQ